MKRRICFLLVICALALVTVSPATAITNHNLHWGFAVGNRFHYTVSGMGSVVPDYYVEIDYVPTIPVDVSSTMDISSNQIGYSYYYENGTVFNAYYYMPWIALPVGNWTLVGDLLVENSYYEYEMINTASEWGVSYDEDYGSSIRTTIVKFSKADGALNLYSVIVDPDVGLTVTQSITRKGGVSLPVLFIGVGSAVVIVAAVGLIYINRK